MNVEVRVVPGAFGGCRYDVFIGDRCVEAFWSRKRANREADYQRSRSPKALARTWAELPPEAERWLSPPE